jgi:hypothetical protein
MEDIWKVVRQRFTSSASSINSKKVPATFNSKYFPVVAGSVNADIGGGKHDTATRFLEKAGVVNWIVDPFNRPPSHYKLAVSKVRNGQSDTATVNNVLNVVKESDIRTRIIRQAHDALKIGGKAFFLIYEGDKTGVGRNTSLDVWQENRKASTYMGQIEVVFGNVVRHGTLLIAEKET